MRLASLVPLSSHTESYTSNEEIAYLKAVYIASNLANAISINNQL